MSRGVEIASQSAKIRSMPVLRRVSMRRLLAILLLLCFGLYGVESEVADVHDTEAEYEHVSAGHELPHAMPVDKAPTDAPSGADNHPVHVCHCTHTHVGVLGTAPTLNLVLVPAPPAGWRATGTAASTPLLPPLRPPIV
jgi:hypothetical protein